MIAHLGGFSSNLPIRGRGFGTLILVALALLSGPADALSDYSVTVVNNGVNSDLNPTVPPIPNGLEVNEIADLAVFGGFEQISSREILLDQGDPSDLILTNFRIRSTQLNPLFTKVITGSGYQLPVTANAAWHVLEGSATILGPIGATATISITLGTLDGLNSVNPGPPAVLTVTKDRDQTNFPFFVRTNTVFYDPPLSAIHTRRVTYTFSFGNGALPGSEIRMTATGDNPFVPEPSTFTLLGIGVIGILGHGWRSRRKAEILGCD